MVFSSWINYLPVLENKMTTPKSSGTTTFSRDPNEKKEISDSPMKRLVRKNDNSHHSLTKVQTMKTVNTSFYNSYSSMSPQKRRQTHLSSKVISPKKGTTENSPRNRRRGNKYFASPKKQFNRFNKSKIFHSPWSLAKNKQTTHDRDRFESAHHGLKRNENYDSSAVALKARSENTVLGKDSLDGVEISLKPHGMELIHVMGNAACPQSFRHVDNPIKNPSSSVKMMEGIMAHTTEVQWKGLEDFNYSALKYHAVCDFNPAIRKHRVPLKRNHDCTKMEDQVGYQGKLSILEKYPILSEDRAIQEELLNLWHEIKAIENDRNIIIKEKVDDDCGPKNIEHQKWTKCATWKCSKHWDIDVYLDGVNRKSLGFKNYALSISKENRKYLQVRRGAFVHAGFKVKDRASKNNNPLTVKSANLLKAFATKCGGNPNSYRPHRGLQDCLSFLDIFGIQLVASHADTVRHLAILADELGSSSFFVSKDDGRSHCEGCLPPRLVERWKNENIHDPDSCFGRIRYLSCGPNGSYYAELVSGQSFWSIGRHDEAFQLIMDKLHVHRIAFGSFDMDSSWIIISKEGQVVWRNIPMRLQQILLNRKPTQAAPCEISLGHEGAYFIRFLDGEIDYCLPSFVSEIATRILSQGAEITSIILNVDAPDAFIIRHTKLSQ